MVQWPHAHMTCLSHNNYHALLYSDRGPPVYQASPAQLNTWRNDAFSSVANLFIWEILCELAAVRGRPLVFREGVWCQFFSRLLQALQLLLHWYSFTLDVSQGLIDAILHIVDHHKQRCRELVLISAGQSPTLRWSPVRKKGWTLPVYDKHMAVPKRPT